jgi:arylsulfatase
VLAPEPFDTMVDPSQVPFDPPTEQELAGKPRYERQMLRTCQGSTHLGKEDIQRSRACYLGLVSHVDDQIGRLLAAMDERRLLDDTLVVVTSDQGVCLGEHGLFMKRNFYEQSAGAILIVSWPGHLPEGKVVDDPVELVDVMPTMLDAAGIEVPSTAQGRSLLPLVAGRQQGRDAVFSEIDFANPQFDRYYLPKSRRVMVRTAEWKMSCFVERSGDARDGDLYHLAEDPHEVRNLWSDKTYRDVVAALEARIRKWDDETRA